MSQFCNFAVVLKVCHVFWEDFRSLVSEADFRSLVSEAGNQRLDIVVREYLEVFREIMRHPEWKHQFDLTFRPVFDAAGNRLKRQQS